MAGLCSNAPGCCAVQEGSTGQTELNAYKKSIEILHNGSKKSLPKVELSSDIWRRRWDAKRRARAVRIPPCSPCIVCRKNKKQRPAGCCSWRRRWDSNPRGIAAKLISSQSRYDRFDTSAYLVFIAPPRTAFGKMRDFDAR